MLSKNNKAIKNVNFIWLQNMSRKEPFAASKVNYALIGNIFDNLIQCVIFFWIWAGHILHFKSTKGGMFLYQLLSIENVFDDLKFVLSNQTAKQ